MRVAFLGATRGMGRALSRLMAARGDQLFLLGRDPDDLQRSAADLVIRGAAAPVETAHCDLLQPSGFGPALDRAVASMAGLDAVVVTAGLFALQEDLEADDERCAELLTADFTNTIRFCEQARRRLLAGGGGRLCVFSSVAGERGRKPVILYGAAKAGLSHYLEGLDHKFHAKGLRTIVVKPGFVRTGMTSGLPEPPFAADPDAVASQVLRAIDRGTPEIFVPAIWQWVMLAIRSMPRFVMRRIGF